MSSLTRHFARAAGAVIACLLLAGPVHAGEFVVNPIRLELGAQARSGVITVRNEGKEKLNFQLDALEWTQDTAGKDQYTETRDVIFFPKIMSIEAGEEGVIRVGARTLVVPVEKTYRLFIEELPGTGPPKVPGGSVTINVLIRFGAPIFIAPVKPADSAEFIGVEIARGVLTLSVKNTGNRHQIVEGIQLSGTDASGTEVYSLTLADRYLLAGTTKSFSATIPADQCLRLSALGIELKTDKFGLKRKLDIQRAMCS